MTESTLPRGPIRAPRGTQLSAKSWLTEAPLRSKSTYSVRWSRVARVLAIRRSLVQAIPSPWRALAETAVS